MAYWLATAILYIVSFSASSALFVTSKCMETMSSGRLYSQCRGRGLINTSTLHLDPATRVLDLTDNEFSRLHGNEFQDAWLHELEEIIMQHNFIEQVDSLAFNGLHLLQFLDLSNNRLSSLQLDFWPPLKTLNLSFNAHFTTWTAISCPTLKVLDLSFCNLKDFPIPLNHNIGNLQYLNLSFNSIEKLQLQQLQFFSLRSFQIQRNPLRCDEEIDTIAKWLHIGNIQSSGFCFHHSTQVYSSEAPMPLEPKPVMVPKNDIIAYNSDGNAEQCMKRLDSMRHEQRLFAITSLAIHLVVLIVVLLFLLVFVCVRRKDKRKERRCVNIALEEAEEEGLPPPPYHTYVSGFSV